MTCPMVILSLCVLLYACDGPAKEARRALPGEEQVTLASGAAGHVAKGKLGGRSWTLRDARFRILDRPRRRYVDLLLSDAHIERCGLPIEREGALVWLRFEDRKALDPGETEIADASSKVRMHYEISAGAKLQSAHRGRGRVRIDASDQRQVSGRLALCFADADHSCIRGDFTARPCLSRIDGRALREPPGLVDEALDPQSTR